MRKSLVGMALALAVFAAQAQSPESGPQAGAAGQDQAEAARHGAWNAYMRRVAKELGRAGDARHLAFAAILNGTESSVPPGTAVPGQAQAWLQAALDAAGREVQAYRLIASAKSPNADALRAEAVRRWSGLEPGNLAPLMYREMPAAQLLQQARSATYSDMALYQDMRWMKSALLRHPPTRQEWAAIGDGTPFSVEEHAAVTAMGISAAFAFPNYLTLTRACKADLLSADAQGLADCRHVAGLLTTRSSTLLDRGVGLALWRRLAQTETERAWALEQRRSLDWLMHQAGRNMPKTEDWLRLLSDPTIENEQQLVERTLRQAGIALEPPEGWQLPVPTPTP